MSRPRAGYIGFNRAPAAAESAPGVWTLREAEAARRAGTWPDSPDPYFSNVSLLLHMDGTNGSTTFTDSSLNARSITTSGSPVISTAQSKFGGSSLYLNGSSYLQIASDSTLDFGTGDWTIEFWAFCTDQDNAAYFPPYISTIGGWSSGSFAIRYDNIGQSQQFAVFWNPSDPLLASGSTYSFNQWRHVAVVRDGTAIRLYVNGVQDATTTVSSSRALNLGLGGGCRIGNGAWDGSKGWLTDYVDSLRVTKGICRYAGGITFTPPTAAFPSR
ncbi:MAG: LamG domain-containing protein [Caulobacteraceae bacterium]|nr:LamG domain-containing protein [Caulobacteraceae bacterium]